MKLWRRVIHKRRPAATARSTGSKKLPSRGKEEERAAAIIERGSGRKKKKKKDRGRGL